MIREPCELVVECYAGHRGDEEPRLFRLGQRAVEVEEILDRWLDPAYRYFKARAGDDAVYILRHDTIADRWELRLFDSSGREDSRLSST